MNEYNLIRRGSGMIESAGPHAASHAVGGSDQLAPAVIGAAAVAHVHAQAEVTGLTTALEGLGTADRIPDRGGFEARAAAVRGLTAGSGFLEWGRRYVGGDPVGEGLWTYSDAMALGRYPTGSPVGAGSHAPVVSVAGCVCHLLAGRSNIEDCYVKFAPPLNAATPSSRHDLVILEVWHERVDLKDVVYPFGGAQCGAGGVSLTDGSAPAWRNDLVAAGYSAYGAWEAAPVAGFCARWSTMTDAQRRAMAADPRHNLYMDHDGAVVQIRWRLRSIVGPGAAWGAVNPLGSPALGYSYDYGANGHVMPRGQKVEVNDFEAYVPNTVYGSAQAGAPVSPGLWIGQETSAVLTPVLGHRGLCFALPVALVKRERNLGIQHAAHNPGGCALAAGAAPTSLAECFSLPRSGGLIASGATAHPSGLYADQVVADDVIDLRLSAHRPDPERLLRRAWQDYRAGTLRRPTGLLPAAGVARAVKAIAPVASAQGLEVEPSAYNPATGEIVYPTAYVGAGAVTVATLVGRAGQAVMQIATDPAVDGILDIDLADGLAVELPYHLPAEV